VASRAKRKQRIRGGRADRFAPSDFDEAQLRRGTAHELEHTSTWSTAQEIAMDHLVEDPRYYEKLQAVEAQPNRARRRVYDTSEEAAAMRARFVDRPVQTETEFAFDWPPMLQHIGTSLAVAYASDKWQPKDRNGRRKLELYKHLAESKNRIFCVPDIVGCDDDPNADWPTYGPVVDFSGVPLPKHFAVLGLFKEANVQLYTGGTPQRPTMGPASSDEGVVTMTVGHGMLGGSLLRWSKLDGGRKDQPFLFVYTASGGVHFIIVGEKLAVHADGITG